MEQPFVSVVIPCRNEGASLARCLDSVLSSGYPKDRMEVIVADGMSDASTRGIIALYQDRDARVRLVENPQQITPAGLNLAIQAARGQFIQRVDAHSVIARDYIRRAVDGLMGCPAWAIGGQMTTVPERNGEFGRPVQTVLSHWFGVGNSRFRTQPGSGEACRDRNGAKEISSAEEAAGHAAQVFEVDTVFNACWRREVFDRVGWFNEKLARSQDIDLSARIRAAGGRMLLDPAMKTHYFSKSQLLPFARQSWNNGVWAILPLAFLGYLPVRPRHLAPLAFVALCGLLLAGTLVKLLPWWAPLATFGPYGAANLVVSCSLAWRARQPQLAGQLPLAFSILHFGYGAGSLWGAARAAVILVGGKEKASPEPAQTAAVAASAGAASPNSGPVTRKGKGL